MYSKHDLMTSDSCCNEPWVAWPGALNPWIKDTTTWAVAEKIKREIKFDMKLNAKKMSLRRKKAIFADQFESLRGS